MSTSSASVRRIAAAVAAACALALCLAMTGVSAHAAGLTISGADFLYSWAGGSQADEDTTGDTVDVLSVSGAQGDTVFFKVTKGDATIADHMAYTLGSEGQTGEGDFAGLASLKFAGGLDTGATYAVSVYADREETSLLYTGSMRAVFAQIDGIDQPVAIGFRTTSAGESRAFAVPQTISLKQGDASVTYQLATDTDQPISEDPYTYYYAPVDDASTYTATISYVDENGKPITTDTYDSIPVSENRTVEIKQFVSSDDGANYYRCLDWSPTVTFSASGTRSLVVSCKQVDASYASQQGFHVAVINYVYVDADGNQKLITSDKVTVANTTYYKVPDVINLGQGERKNIEDTEESKKYGYVATYRLSGDQDSRLGTDHYLVLQPSDSSNDVTVNYAYDETGPVEWTVQCVYKDPQSGKSIILNDDESPQEVERTIGAYKEYEAHDIPKDGTTYVPADGYKTYKYVYGSDETPLTTTIYYVPSGKKPNVQDYTVTINYADYATKKVITSKQVTISLSHGDYALETDDQFSLGGVTYVRLAGQEQPLRHSFYAGPATYTVWYRDINNVADRNVRVTRVNVVYLPGTNAAATTNGTAGGTATTGAVGTGTGAAAGTTATTAIPTTDNGLAAVGDGTTSTLVGGDGTDLNTERITDEQTPLASGAPDSTQSAGLGVAQGVGIGAAAAAACLLILFLVRRRRNQGDQDQTSSSGTEGR